MEIAVEDPITVREPVQADVGEGVDQTRERRGRLEVVDPGLHPCGDCRSVGPSDRRGPLDPVEHQP